jgi:hypothetical protein
MMCEAIGEKPDDPRRILEIRQRLHLRMAVKHIGDNPQRSPGKTSSILIPVLLT